MGNRRKELREKARIARDLLAANEKEHFVSLTEEQRQSLGPKAEEIYRACMAHCDGAADRADEEIVCVFSDEGQMFFIQQVAIKAAEMIEKDGLTTKIFSKRSKPFAHIFNDKPTEGIVMITISWG